MMAESTPETNYDHEVCDLFAPSLSEVASVLSKGLPRFFQNSTVRVMDCPNLTEAPFHLSTMGLTGCPTLADVGAVSYLLPHPRLEKSYKLSSIQKLCSLENGCVLGAACGYSDDEDCNCEMIANLWGNCNQSRICRVVDDSYELKDAASDKFSLLGNFYLSEGGPGPVLEIVLQRRKTKENFMSSIQIVLNEHYQQTTIGLGGMFLIEQGKANIHVMPSFSKSPILSDMQVNKWLKFFEMSAPLICVGTVLSRDPGLDIRTSHFHCFSQHGHGGHYHYDTTPLDVSYRAYLNVAERLVRIDRPT